MTNEEKIKAYEQTLNFTENELVFNLKEYFHNYLFNQHETKYGKVYAKISMLCEILDRLTRDDFYVLSSEKELYDHFKKLGKIEGGY